MVLTQHRKGEIALAVVKAMVEKKGLSNLNANNVLRDIGNRVANEKFLKEIEVTSEEIVEFATEIIKEVVVEFTKDLKKGLGKVSQ